MRLRFDQLVAPTCLKGDVNSASRQWRKLARRAWRSGHWSEILDGMELTGITSPTIPIVICRMNGAAPPGIAWNLDVVRESLFDVSTAADWRRYESLVLEGCSHFWYCLPMLGTFCGALTFMLDRTDSSIIEDFQRPLLSRIVSWACEMESVAERLSFGVSGAAGWTLGVAELARKCYGTTAGEAFAKGLIMGCEFLVARGCAQVHGGRFALLN